MIEPLSWTGGALRFLDQTRLPDEEVYTVTGDYREVCNAIRRLAIRGAPALGLAGAYALALAAPDLPEEGFTARLRARAAEIIATRPTAVNLGRAVERSLRAAAASPSPAAARAALVAEACRQHEETQRADRVLASIGAPLVPAGATVLTHCNTGALATGGYGTALGMIHAAWEQGRVTGVIACETRPLLQGARLTAWELLHSGIPVTVIADSAAGRMMQEGAVTCVVTGADRIAANGDTANKIGTYQLAVLAHSHGLPFYIAAPLTTVDPEAPDGAAIPVEERPAEEVTQLRGTRLTPAGVAVRNPAFDVTPARLITAIVTEHGIARPPYRESLSMLATQPVASGA